VHWNDSEVARHCIATMTLTPGMDHRPVASEVL